jgi:hemerythrin superfamily protein
MDAIAFLKKDHEKVSALFQRFNDGGGLTGVVRRLTGNSASPAQRRSIADQICRSLDVHAQIEESAFYPAVRGLRDEGLDEMLDEALREHGSIKDRVERARLALDDDGRLKGAMTSLQECVDHHVAEEEREMFPKVADLMPEQERSALGRDLAARHRSAGGSSAAAAPARGRGKAGARATRRKKSVQHTTTAAARRRVRKTTAKAKRARTTGKARRAR